MKTNTKLILAFLGLFFVTLIFLTGFGFYFARRFLVQERINYLQSIADIQKSNIQYGLKENTPNLSAHFIKEYSGLGKSGEIIIARRDKNGNAVFLRPSRLAPHTIQTVLKTQTSVAIIQALLKKEGVFTEYIDYRNVPVVGVTRYIPEKDWGLVIKMDRSEFYLPLYELIGAMTGILIVFSLAGVILIPFFSNLITAELRRAENELSAEKECLRITLMSIGDGVIVVDEDNKITMMNRIAESLTGWQLAEAEEKSIEDVLVIYDEFTRQPRPSPTKEAIAKRKVILLANHTQLLSKYGREIAIEDSAAPIIDSSGALIGAVIVFRDVTKRRELEKKITQLANIVENSDDAILSKTLDGVITSWNKAAEQIYGYSEQEIIGQSLDVLIPPDKQAELDQIMKKIMSGERVKHLETLRKTKDGRLINVSITISPILNSRGEIIGASTIARDVSDRVELEKLRDELTQMIVHDLKNPLAGLSAGLDLLEEECGASAEQARHLAIFRQSIRKMLAMIMNLLDISRLESQTIQLNKMVFRAADLVEPLSWLNEMAKQEKKKIDFAIDSNLTVFADQTLLMRALENLIINSLKHTTEGGRISLHISKSSAQNEIIFEVTDDGEGIPREYQGQLFNKFFTVASHEKKGRTDTGLGLAFCKLAVEAHGGKIGFESEANQGARFYFTLPLEG